MAEFRRFHPFRVDQATRDRHAEVSLAPRDLIHPLFVVPGRTRREPVSGLPGARRLSPDQAVAEVREILGFGVSKFLLFGVIDSLQKDPNAGSAADPDGPVCRALGEIRSACPEATLITDVCLCGYTDHGHCGLLGQGGTIDNDASIKLLAGMAVAHARAGAEVCAPSAMMDGQVLAMRRALDAAGYSREKVGIMGYSAKFASQLYGPFREAAESAPSHGDRRGYQMDFRAGSQALEEMAADIEEGADWIMVKPAHAYLDVIARGAAAFPDTPMAAYHVSGEYAMLCAAAEAGVVSLRPALEEVSTAIRRAGASAIISYGIRELFS